MTKLRVFATLIAAFDAWTTNVDERKYSNAETVTSPDVLLIDTAPDCGLVVRAHPTGLASVTAFVNVNFFATLVTLRI